MNTDSSDDALIAVFETGDPAEAAIVRSMLEGADIPFIAQGEDRYDAFRGAFRGTVFNPHGRPVVFLVPAGFEKEALQLLDTTDGGI